VIAALELSDEAARASRAKVVDLRPELKRRRWEAENRWDLSKEDLDRIAADLWPELDALEEVQVVRGKAPKRPPLTYEAKNAISEIDSKLYMLGFEIQKLSEVALKGFAFEALRHARTSDELKPLWEGIAAVAEHHRELKARHRTGRGAWYAVLHLFRKEQNMCTEIDHLHERCETRKAAVEVVKRLVAENVHRLGEDIMIETEIVSELEWNSLDED
jgi:hypothetical protein